MLSTILQRMSVKGSSVYGIELNIGGGKNRYWTLVQLALGKNKEVRIVRQEAFEEVFDAKRLSELNLKKSIPIVLCVTGTGVFTSKLNRNDAINSMFSGLDSNEIYSREYGVESFRYGCAIRKDILYTLIEEITDQDYFIWDISVSSLTILEVLSLLQVPKQELRLDRYRIQLQPIAIEQCSTYREPLFLQEHCYIGAERTTTTMLPSLATAIGFYVNSSATDEGLLSNQRKEFRAFKKCKLVGYSFLTVLLVVLFINFMMYSKYTRQLEDSQLALNEKQRQDMQLNMLKRELSEKQGVLSAMGIQREVPLSFITDRFAACLPRGIRLDKLNINPLADKLRDQKPIIFTEGKLRAEGVCNNPDDISILLERLKKEDWLAKVDKKEYREDDLKGRFIIELSYEQE